MARRRTVLAIPIPAGGVEVADVLAVLGGVAPSYDLTRLEWEAPRAEGEPAHLVLTAGQRRLRPGALIDADSLPGMDDIGRAQDMDSGWQPDENLGGMPPLEASRPLLDEHAWANSVPAGAGG